jgi:shikimate dehydrogenase
MRNESRPALLAGLIGAGIGRSLSPALHEREGEEQGLRLLYRRLDLTALGLRLDALPELLTAAERFGFAGLNITYPAKQAVIAHLHALSPEAGALGAVNTVVLQNGRRIGHNTDASGFAEAFRRRLQGAARGTVAQFGAGGAGAAVAHALLSEGVGRLLLRDVEPARAAALAEQLCARFGAGRAALASEQAALEAADGVVNCTPIGMAAHPGTPLDTALLRPAQWVADIVYVPIETALLRAARARGCRTMGGGGMAVFQAAGAFRLFTGLEPDAERMLAHFAELTAEPVAA